MVGRVKGIHPALKHGAYSATAVLPGENPAEFEKLHRQLIAELKPSGVFEDDIVATIARLIWRKQNLTTLRIAELARERCSTLQAVKPPPFLDLTKRKEAADDEARKELGDTYELVEIGESATSDGLTKELDIIERLDAQIDKCLKRLLLVRGLKSISTASSLAPPRIAGPSRAA
jgi:hypothetical protein